MLPGGTWPHFLACVFKARPGHCTAYMESEVAQLPFSDQLWLWFQKNRKPAIWGSSIVAIVGLVVWFALYQHDQRQVEASQALSSVVLAQAGQAASQAPSDPGAYLKVVADYPNSEAAARATLLAAAGYFTEGKYDQAMAQFQRVTRQFHQSALLSQALLGVAACLDAQGKATEATAAYKELVDSHPTSPVVPQAKFALGRLAEAQNQPEQAYNYYEQVAEMDPYGSIGSEAGMRTEELKLKYPKLAPVPAAAPGSAPFQVQKALPMAPTNPAKTPAPAKK